MLFSYLFLLILAVNFTWILISSETHPTRPMYNCSWDDGMEDLEIEFDMNANLELGNITTGILIQKHQRHIDNIFNNVLTNIHRSTYQISHLS